MALETSVRWHGRDATRLTNGLIELTVLSTGGHFADLRFISEVGPRSQNVLWEAPWVVAATGSNYAHEVSQTAGFTGHALCLDYFGPPSANESAAGLPIHGEAGAQHWEAHTVEGDENTSCLWRVKLPVAQLTFERTACIEEGESAVCVEETVRNDREQDHFCHWVEHATFAPPFLDGNHSAVEMSGKRGITSPALYFGKDGTLLSRNRRFLWPFAPHWTGAQRNVNLREPFSDAGRGFLATVEADPKRQVEFVTAVNWHLGLGVGYCFRRLDFPWVTIWEENRTRSQPPWNGTTQARGMEFGTTPLPLGREETFRRGALFGNPCWCVIPARGKKTARYVIFLFKIPRNLGGVQDIEVDADEIRIVGKDMSHSFSIPVRGCGDFLAEPIHSSTRGTQAARGGGKRW